MHSAFLHAKETSTRPLQLSLRAESVAQILVLDALDRNVWCTPLALLGTQPGSTLQHRACLTHAT